MTPSLKCFFSKIIFLGCGGIICICHAIRYVVLSLLCCCCAFEDDVFSFLFSPFVFCLNLKIQMVKSHKDAIPNFQKHLEL